MVHELAHVLLHRNNSADASKRVIETEAEAVAFVVAEAVGLKTGSAAADYIQLWNGDRDTLLALLGADSAGGGRDHRRRDYGKRSRGGNGRASFACDAEARRVRRWVRGARMEGQQPIERFRAGAVTGALFEDAVTINGQPGRITKATIGRRYKDRNGQWKTSQSFSRNEIPLAIYVLQKAFAAMVEKPSEEVEVARGGRDLSCGGLSRAARSSS